MSLDQSPQPAAGVKEAAVLDAKAAPPEVLARAWSLRTDAPLEALRLVASVAPDTAATITEGAQRASYVTVRQDPELRLRAHAIRAASLLVLDDVEAAYDEVLGGIEALERLCDEGSTGAAAGRAGPLSDDAPPAARFHDPSAEQSVKTKAKAPLAGGGASTDKWPARPAAAPVE